MIRFQLTDKLKYINWDDNSTWFDLKFLVESGSGAYTIGFRGLYNSYVEWHLLKSYKRSSIDSTDTMLTPGTFRTNLGSKNS